MDKPNATEKNITKNSLPNSREDESKKMRKGIFSDDPDLPKRAFTPPNIWAVVASIFLTLSILVFFGGPNSLGFAVFLTFSPPVILLWLFVNYHSGLTIAKSSYKLATEKKPWTICLKMLAIQLISIAISLLAINGISGYPVPDCFDSCGYRDFISVLIRLIIVSSIGFAPAYYAIWLYYGWVTVYHIRKPRRPRKQPQVKSDNEYSDPSL